MFWVWSNRPCRRIWRSSIWHIAHSYETWHIHMWHDSFIWDMTHSYETWLIHMRHDSLLWVVCACVCVCVWSRCLIRRLFIWLIHMRHDSFIRDMTHSYETWLIVVSCVCVCVWESLVEVSSPRVKTCCDNAPYAHVVRVCVLRVCVCACICACMHACVCVCVCIVSKGVSVYVRVCVLWMCVCACICVCIHECPDMTRSYETWLVRHDSFIWDMTHMRLDPFIWDMTQLNRKTLIIMEHAN